MSKLACVMFLVLAIGCGKKDDATGDKKPDNADKTEKADKVEKADKAATPADAAEYEKRSVAFGEKMRDQLKPLGEEAGKACDKTAEKIGKWIDDNRAENTALVAFEKTHPDAEKDFDSKHQGLRKEVESAINTIAEACQSSQAMKDAFAKMQD